jgi:hypothetical protein
LPGCNNGRQFTTVLAREESVLAEIPNDAFLEFVEGLGSRMAKKVSRYIVDLFRSWVYTTKLKLGSKTVAGQCLPSCNSLNVLALSVTLVR